MKKKILISTFLMSIFFSCYSVRAEANSQNANGNLKVEDKGTSDLVDPEFPEQIVNPGEGFSTTGPLRIDYVSDLSFGSHKIDSNNRTYNSLAQQFLSDTNPRGYYIQISDFSSESSGWNLTVTQEEQFKSSIIQDNEKQTLIGSVLSFDKGWANTNGASESPNVTRDAMQINETGIAYNIATASEGQGKGTWLIEFGASDENVSSQKSTLELMKDSNGKQIIDSRYNKPAYSNSAISLTVPKTTKIYPVQYTTTLTWTLEAGPKN